jgi:hypothetical protein
MTPLHIKLLKIRKVFPPRDALATMIARICILREDAMIEMLAILEQDMGKLDRPDIKSRQFYFLRNLIRTHAELYSAIQTLLMNPKFKQLMNRRTPAERAEFQRNQSALNYHQVLKEVRNDICAHVRQQAVQAALNRISAESFGFFQLGESAMKTQFGFCSEVVAAILLKGIPKRELKSNIGSKKFRQLRASLELSSLADGCFVMYALDRGIRPY